MKKNRVFLLVCVLVMVVLAALPALAYAADDVPAADGFTAAIRVIKDYLPLLSVLLFLLGQALKTKPGFQAWRLPFIMGGVGLVFGLAIAILGNYDPLNFFLAIVEGTVAGLASTGINEAKKQTSGTVESSS
jgi:membrane protease YdiL (CAAX protease family)